MATARVSSLSAIDFRYRLGDALNLLLDALNAILADASERGPYAIRVDDMAAVMP